MQGSFHVLRWSSRFTRRTLRSGPGGEIYAYSELAEVYAPVSLLDIYRRLGDRLPPLSGAEDCESLFPDILNERAVTEILLVRYFLAI